MTNRFYSAIIDYADLRGCWNRQTGKLEVLVSVLACGFKSHFPHQCKGHSIFRVSFIFCYKLPQITIILKSTLESHEIFDFVVEETCFLSRTRQAPGAQSVLACGFKSHFPHRCKGHSIFRVSFIFCYKLPQITIILKSTLESHEIFDFVVEETCFLSRTRQAPGAQSVLACGFKSHFPHRCKGHSIFRVSFIFCYKLPQITIILKSTLESHEIFDFVVEETCFLSRTRQAPGAQSVLACGFKSHFLHRCKGHSIFECPFRLSINPRTAKMRINHLTQNSNRISKRISHSRKKRLCESIFAYCVNRPSTYLCTPVGAVSLSACVSQRLQRVEKYFSDTLKGHSIFECPLFFIFT